jgi:hypothetical protein
MIMQPQLGKDSEIKSTSAEARSKSSGRPEIVMHQKLGKNKAGRLADANLK